jgi:TRAP-type C4-dicarboxylate transport system permease small subunit
MKKFTDIVHLMSKWGMALGAAFLVCNLVLIVANVIVRAFGGVIAGTYELAEMLVIVTIAFALGYTAIHKGHIVVDFLVRRFPNTLRNRLILINSLLSLLAWGIIGWASYRVMVERWLNERTEMLEVLVLPFRIIWVTGIVIFCLVFITDFLNSLRQEKE